MKKMLCAFANTDNVEQTYDYIKNTFNISTDIFLFENLNNLDEVFFTFVVTDTYMLNRNIIVVNRKSKTNTIYTINAMNEIIKNENNGVLDTTFQLNWDIYIDTLLIYRNKKLEIIPFNYIEKL